MATTLVVLENGRSVHPTIRVIRSGRVSTIFLDIIVSADRSIWYWKDEEEVREALARGIFTAEHVDNLYQQGQHALLALLKNEPPFDANWENWKPSPAIYEPFDLPTGWEDV